MKRKLFLFLGLAIAGLIIEAQNVSAQRIKNIGYGLFENGVSASLAQLPFLEFTTIAQNQPRPVGITNAGDGSGRLFVALQEGKIMIFDGNQMLTTPFLDITSLVSCCGERGLLGFAFHPNYETNGYFYVNYTRAGDGATIVARYQVSANPNVADLESEAIILVVNQPNTNHNGGQLQFGPDGYLYIGMGDGGGSNDPENNAQNPTSLLGKMLRIDVDGAFPYSIPLDNPFISNPSVANEIWALGLRNPWRFSFDRLTGDLFIADVGQNAWEEINYQPASSEGGENYGWSCYEALHDNITTRDCTTYGTLTIPILEYDHGLGCSVTGGYRYRGSAYSKMSGVYLYGDFCSGRVWGAAQNENVWDNSMLIDTPYQITAFGEDENGELYLADYAGQRIYHIAASSFKDVLPSHWAWQQIEAIYKDGLTSGCGINPLRYCPGINVSRAQMAVFLLRGIHGNTYIPPASLGMYDDVPTNYWAVDWIEQLAAEGVTAGCGEGNYCPENPVTRAQMAVFLLRSIHGNTYVPPQPSGIFNDVPSTHWAAAWIEQLYAEGLTAGCGGGNYCPSNPVTRAQMAVFLITTFNLSP